MAAKSLIGLFREINPEMVKIASMNMKDFKPLQYGKIRMTEQIEGIELLEEYKKQQIQDGVVEDNDDEWVGWEVASNASSNEEDWIDVSDDKSDDKDDNDERDDKDDDDEIGDIDDDDEIEGDIGDDDEIEGDMGDDDEIDDDIGEINKDENISSLATTQLLTPADFFKLNELKMKHKVKQLIDGGKRKSDAIQNDELPDIVDVNFITGPRKKAKQDYEERIESIKAGREGREKFGGPKKGKKVEGTSTTNKEKARHKAFMMVIHKKNMINKKRMSLRDKQIQLTRRGGFKKKSK
ncbi:10991_t:CDS:2 [Cetraspora pellucida]|uniref:10991_t:CDS:1 n=1 Tax=Cetraspora pellucida TaxID=1433469 RepID=A0ACA9LDT8_9GLOM|nr:10991_t:CDS:2 [Cetraspora pellucida]